MKTKKIAILYPILFFFATSMFIRSWVPAFHSSWPTLLAGCLLSVIVIPQFFRTRWFLYIAVYSFVVVLNWLLGDRFFNNPMLVFNEIAILFLFSSFCYYIYKSNDNSCVMLTFGMMIVLLGIAAVGSYIVNKISPSIIREATYLEVQEDYDTLIGYYRMGLSNYLLPHGILAIIPPLILLIKRSNNNKWLRFISLLLMVFTLFLVYLSGATMVMLLAIVALMSLFYKRTEKNNYKIVWITVVLFIPILIYPDIISSLVYLFSGETSATYALHFEDMVSYIEDGVSGNTSSRISLYTTSFLEFIKSPLWGTNNMMGEHSVLLDRLGALGILGFIPLIGMLVSFIRYVRGYLDDAENSFFNVTILVMIIMLLLKGIEDKEVWLMFIALAPALLFICHKLVERK